MEKPGLVSQKRAVEQYHAAQTKASICGSIPSQTSYFEPLPATTQVRTPTAASSQMSLEPPSSSGNRVAVAVKRRISSVSVHSEDDGEAASEEHERPRKNSDCIQVASGFKMLIQE
jgi:hypothetical protein